METLKIRARSENFHFQWGELPDYGVVRIGFSESGFYGERSEFLIGGVGGGGVALLGELIF